jgi:hypothetical protein
MYNISVATHASEFREEQDDLEITNLLTFLALFNGKVRLPLFYHGKLSVLVSMVTLLIMITLWLNNVSNYGTHCSTSMS